MLKIIKTIKGKKEAGKLSDLNKNTAIYVDIEEPSNEELDEIAQHIQYPIKEIREDLKRTSRPKVDDLGDYSLIVFKSPYFDAKAKTVKTTALMIFLSKKKNNVIVIRKKRDVRAIDRIEALIAKDKNFMKKGPGYFVFRLLGFIEDDFFDIIEQIGDKVDVIEEKVLAGGKEATEKETMKSIFMLKKSLIYLHKALVADREVISAIEKEYLDDISRKDLKHYRTLYNDVAQMIENVSTYSEILTGALDVHLANVSNNLNNIVKKVTVWGTFIFIPTVIASIYGMNFKYMPELEWQYGYLFALGIMFFSVFAAWTYFRRKNWL
ncbi:MAG: magnesium/cobalt transporter CorA [Nanoarchaeota archaeon]|nr:magnesium/cobalt transporter CorA [Nanoarchaeota archaeon]